MTNVADKNPEIETFSTDRLKIDNTLIKYIDYIKTNHKETFNSLKGFIKAFSTSEQLNSDLIHNFADLPQWTFTKKQQIRAISLLKSALNNYPVPKNLRGIAKGGLLDLSTEINKKKFFQKIDNFVNEKNEFTKSLKPQAARINTNLETILLHNNDEEFYDPFLNGKINSLHTFNIFSQSGLSIKDIMAEGMISDALKSGELELNNCIAEGTSGNTGAGLAICAARLGIGIFLVIPNKMSSEKILRLRLLGAHVIVTATKVDASDFRSYYSVRDYLGKSFGFWTPQQYDNPANFKSHEKITGPAIWEATKGNVTAVIATTGTCGTLTGIAKFLKKKIVILKFLVLILLVAFYT
jgi:hypothetical protein